MRVRYPDSPKVSFQSLLLFDDCYGFQCRAQLGPRALEALTAGVLTSAAPTVRQWRRSANSLLVMFSFEAGMMLDVRRDRDRLDVFQDLKPALLRPGQKFADGVIICDPGILVTNWNRKEFEKALGRLRSNIGDGDRNVK